MGDGLFEVRSHLDDGKIERVLFGIVGGSMVLLHRVVKKTPTTPTSELDLARRRLREIAA